MGNGERTRFIPLFDAGPPTFRCGLWVHYARVLIDLAEQVLAVDRLERPSPKAAEAESQPTELLLGQLRHRVDDLVLRHAAGVAEALLNPAPCAGPRDHELGLLKARELAVVQVDGELERQEVSQ